MNYVFYITDILTAWLHKHPN